MAAGLPEFIDPITWAEAGRQMQGRLSLAAMPRLRAALHSDAAAGDVGVELHGGLGDHGLRVIRGRITGALDVPCQRCLQVVTLPVDVDVALGLVPSQREADMVPEPYEAVVVTERAVPVAAIVEDELLMAIPIVVMHAAGDCPAAADGKRPQGPAGRPNPFAVLKRLKK